MQLANEIELDTIINKAIINLARAYLQIGNYPKSLTIYQEIIKSKTAESNDLLAPPVGPDKKYTNGIACRNEGISNIFFCK